MNKTQIIKNIKHDSDKNTKNKNNNRDVDSSDISSCDENYDNMTLDEVSQKGKEKFFKTELMEKIVKYIKIDDTIKEKQKELQIQVKALKTQKTDMEKYIISYLEAIKEDFVNIEGSCKLTKAVSTTKGAIKIDNIKTSVIDGIRKQHINIEQNKLEQLLESVLESVDKNRPTKTRTYIKRTKGKNQKPNSQDNHIAESDDDIPKY
jgi:hypothetical protein